jgi:hypothetical protein
VTAVWARALRLRPEAQAPPPAAASTPRNRSPKGAKR